MNSPFPSPSQHKKAFRVHTGHEISPGRSDILLHSPSRSAPSRFHSKAHSHSPSDFTYRSHFHELNQPPSSNQIYNHHPHDLSSGSFDDSKKVWKVPTAHETPVGKTDIPLPPSPPPQKLQSKEIERLDTTPRSLSQLPNSHLKKGLQSEYEPQQQWKQWQGQWQKWHDLEKQTKTRKKLDSKNKKMKKKTNLSPRSFQQPQQQRFDQTSDLENRFHGNDEKQSENSDVELNPMPLQSSPEPSPPSLSSSPAHHLSVEEIASLWHILHVSLVRLIDLGYDRSLLFSVLPFIEKRIFHKSLKYLSQRFEKRVSQTWQNDEPVEVVQLCQRALRAYEKLHSELPVSSFDRT
jgi:hypothetical protein